MHVWAQARPLFVAAGLAVALAASAFALQAFALPPPGQRALVAAAAIKTLDEYRVVRAVEQVAGRRVSAACFQGWFRTGSRANVRGAGAVLDDGARILDIRGRFSEFGRHRDPRALARIELALACPRVLGNVLARRLAHRRLELVPAAADGRRAYVLQVSTSRTRAALSVDARTLAPLAIVVRGRHVVGESDVEVAQHDRAALRRIVGILRSGGERYGYAYPA
jgi:hypothetical protein